MELFIELLKNYCISNGLLELIQFEDSLRDYTEKHKIHGLEIPMTLRRVEVLVFINSKLKSAINDEDFEKANDLLEIRRFYWSDYLPIYFTDRGFSLSNPKFFQDYFIFTLNLLKQFETNSIFDKDNSLYLTYNENQIIQLSEIIELLNKDEILWGWNQHQFRNEDLLVQLRNGADFSIEKLDLKHENFKRIVSVCNKSSNSIIFIIIEAMAYHEDEIKSFVEHLENNFGNLSFKIGIKEVAELVPKINLIHKN